MDNLKELNSKLTENNIKTLKERSVLKQIVYDKTRGGLKILKKILQEVVTNYNNKLENIDSRVLLEYRERGVFEAELKIAGDLIIFNMHTNVFEFPKEHAIFSNDLLEEKSLNSYAGIINIYNFLSDSFKYHRLDDVGYLIGRVFINKEGRFFVEGERELGFNFPSFKNNDITEDNFRLLVESAIAYVLKFELFVPAASQVGEVTVNYMKEKINKHKMQTGKRLGFLKDPGEDNAFLSNLT